MSQPFIEFLHSADADSIPEEMLGLGRKWLLDLLGVAAGATDTNMSRIMRDHAAEHFAPGKHKVAMLFDGYFTTAEEFRNYLWLAAADISGIVAGVLLAIAAFAIVIWSYEKSLPSPASSPPPSEEEIKHVISIANSHIGGEEE